MPSNHRTISGDEFNDIKASSREVGSGKKKSFMMNRIARRGSSSSNFTQRSSNNNINLHNHSNLKGSAFRPRVGVRTSANFASKIPGMEGGELRRERRSRFQIISKMEQETLKQELNMFQTSSLNDSEEPEIRPRNISRARSFKEEVESSYSFSFRAFVIFAEEETHMHIFKVEHVYD